MSLPDKIWAADGYINGVVGGFWSPDEDADETPYLRLDGPTLQAVREALRDASCLLPLIGFRVVKVNGQYIDREDVETRARAALKLLEGK